MTSHLAIVIVNWNTGKLLTECLQSILDSHDTALITDIIVVDSGSTDNSVAQAEVAVAHDPQSKLISWIKSTDNIGFAKSNNLGFALLQDKYEEDVPHVLLLNPDTAIAQNTVAELLKTLDEHPLAGVVGPQLRNADGSLQMSVRAYPTLIPLLIMLLKLPRLWPKVGVWRHYLQLDFDYTQEQAVDQVMGAAFLIRNTVFKDVPRLDERYFVWFEEVDYCQRAKQRGWEVWFTPRTTVTHYGGVSFNQLVGWARVQPWLHSMQTYVTTYLPQSAQLLFTVLLPLGWLLSIPASLGHVVLRQSNKDNL